MRPLAPSDQNIRPPDLAAVAALHLISRSGSHPRILALTALKGSCWPSRNYLRSFALSERNIPFGHQQRASAAEILFPHSARTRPQSAAFRSSNRERSLAGRSCGRRGTQQQCRAPSVASSLRCSSHAAHLQQGGCMLHRTYLLVRLMQCEGYSSSSGRSDLSLYVILADQAAPSVVAIGCMSECDGRLESSNSEC